MKTENCQTKTAEVKTAYAIMRRINRNMVINEQGEFKQTNKPIVFNTVSKMSYWLGADDYTSILY